MPNEFLTEAAKTFDSKSVETAGGQGGLFWVVEGPVVDRNNVGMRFIVGTSIPQGAVYT